jgi:hypothetical protein
MKNELIETRSLSQPLATITYQQNCKITSGGCDDEKFFRIEHCWIILLAMIMTIVYRSGVDNVSKASKDMKVPSPVY